MNKAQCETYPDKDFDERCGEGVTTVEVFYERFVGNHGLYFLEPRALDGTGARKDSAGNDYGDDGVAYTKLLIFAPRTSS